MKKLDYCEKAICRKIGDVFELADKKGYYPQAIVENWCNSTIAIEMYELVAEKIAQGRLYVLNDLINEYPSMKNDRSILTPQLMYWIGYIITYASFSLEMPPKEIYEKYDISSYIASYDVLHTLSASRMIEEMVNEYDKVKNIKVGIF